jgi:hypothetical protein
VNTIRLMYVSESVNLTSPEQLQEMVAQAGQNNVQKDVTGVLLKCGNIFYQILEGDNITVGCLFEKIAKDVRHYHVRLVDKRLINLRSFGQWSMGCLNLDEEYGLDFKGFRSLREQVQSIVEEQRNSTAAVVEIIKTLPRILEKKTNIAA